MKKSGSIDISGCLSRLRQQCGRGLHKSGRGQKFARALRAIFYFMTPPPLDVLDPPLVWTTVSAS